MESKALTANEAKAVFERFKANVALLAATPKEIVKAAKRSKKKRKPKVP